MGPVNILRTIKDEIKWFNIYSMSTNIAAFTFIAKYVEVEKSDMLARKLQQIP